uniref:Uncharacterized protein n=1 Tax=Anopheles minimus TaxID=112268 RepID=A0A182VQM3_9DIPT
MSSANVESSAANKQPVRVVPLNFEAASPTKLPEWLLKPKALEEPTHQLCTLEVQDFTAKRVKLLYLDTGAKLDDSKHTTVMQNTKSTVEPVNKPVSNENTAPKVPPHVVEPQRKNQPAMKSNNENIEPSTAQKDCKTLNFCSPITPHAYLYVVEFSILLYCIVS